MPIALISLARGGVYALHDLFLLQGPSRLLEAWLPGKGHGGGWSKRAIHLTAWAWRWPHSFREKLGGTVLSTTGSWWKMRDALGERNEEQMALIVSLSVTTDKRNSALLTFKRYQKYQWAHSMASWRFPCQGVQTPLYFYYWTVHKNCRW